MQALQRLRCALCDEIRRHIITIKTNIHILYNSKNSSQALERTDSTCKLRLRICATLCSQLTPSARFRGHCCYKVLCYCVSFPYLALAAHQCVDPLPCLTVSIRDSPALHSETAMSIHSECSDGSRQRDASSCQLRAARFHADKEAWFYRAGHKLASRPCVVVLPAVVAVVFLGLMMGLLSAHLETRYVYTA